MLLRKHIGGCTVAGHEWAEDGAVVEVPDELGTELMAIAPGDYEHVLEDEPAAGPGDQAPADPSSSDTGDSSGQGDGGGSSEEDVKQPNKAASAEDWSAYALAQGLPEDVVLNATRKAIVDHFNDGPSLVEGSTEGK
ncbi:hypothetical protein [Amycolatopsis sp. CFH S0078]|uniref:hypothetical protein n=1 Tax=Amycolatopsis sp. CFH S0078 TaxID=1644108 RepID=UPI00106F05B9|nr:hypothetical protein [Amycolatopsis sp. CFH S0078]